MRKFAIAIALLSTLVLASCGGNTPEDAAKGFMTALIKGDVDKAKELSTEKSHKIVGLIAAMTASQADSQSEEQKKKMEETLAALDKIKCEVDGDTAKCAPEGENKKIDLVKEDGKWKVDFKKAGPGGGDQPADEGEGEE